MDISTINFEIAALLKFLGDNPGALLHFLAYACAITLIIAIVTDAFLARRQGARDGKTLPKQPKPRSDLMLRPLPFEMAKARDHSPTRNSKRSEF